MGFTKLNERKARDILEVFFFLRKICHKISLKAR
jgi:hypothetical protein